MYKAINKPIQTCIAKIVLKISIFECSILQQLHDCLRVNKLLMLKKKKEKITKMVWNLFQPYTSLLDNFRCLVGNFILRHRIITFIVGWRDRRSFQIDNLMVSWQGQVHYNKLLLKGRWSTELFWYIRSI